MICHHCRSEIRFEERPSRSEECPACGADVHCCLNCENYDVSAHNRCREPQAEWVSDREKANFCDYFTANRLKPSGSLDITRDSGRKAFDDLFKK